MKLRLWGRLLKFILDNPLPFVLNIIIKDPFFITCNDILEKQVISLSWKKTYCYGYGILFFSLRAWGSQIPRLFTFPTFIKWWQIVDWDVMRSSANSWVLLCGLQSTNSLKASWLRCDEHLVLGWSLNEVLPKWNFENQFGT